MNGDGNDQDARSNRGEMDAPLEGNLMHPEESRSGDSLERHDWGEEPSRFPSTERFTTGPTDQESTEPEEFASQERELPASSVLVDRDPWDQQFGAGPSRRRRSSLGGGIHALVFVAALAGWVVIAIGLPFVIGEGLTEDVYFSEQARDVAVQRATILALAGYVLYVVGTMALIARRVGYRVRDGLLIFVPFYSLYFVPKMLWRWTALPARPWDPGEPSGERSEPAPPAERPGRLQLVIGLLGFLVVAGAIGYGLSQQEAEGSRTDDWRTTRVSGMSISLPGSFEVTTDPNDVAQGAAEVGQSTTDDFAELVRQFPDLFVLAAFEPLPGEVDVGTSLMVMRFPSGGSLDDSVREFSAGFEEAGFFEITAQNDVRVGAGRYAAVRIDAEGNLPGFPTQQGPTYLIDGGSQVWMVDFTTLREEYQRFSPIFDRSIASLTLP
jgi:hypothetical protein